MRHVVLVSALIAGLLPAAAAQAQAIGKPQPYGGPIEKWVFTRTVEKPGLINCRAQRRVGGRDDILAMRTNGKAYMSVRADERKAKYKDSFIVPFRERSNGMQWDMTAEANGVRLWFEMPPNGIDIIAGRGGYNFYLGGTEDRDRVNLGKSALAAWKRVRECIVASGG